MKRKRGLKLESPALFAIGFLLGIFLRLLPSIMICLLLLLLGSVIVKL